MKTNITRQLCASVYLNLGLRERVIHSARNPYNANVASAGIDEILILKHALNAKNRDRNFNLVLFVPSLIMIVTFFVAFPFFLLTFLVVIVIVIVKDSNSKDFIKKHFLSRNFDDNFQYDGPGKELIANLQRKTTKNVVYYSGYSPFVGSGYEIGGWSFVIDIDKGKTDLGTTSIPEEFREDELYAKISDELRDLQLSHCSVEDKAYFNGKKIRENSAILPQILNSPATVLPETLMKDVMDSKIEDARFYKSIQVSGWDGDLIVSAFLRVQKNAKTLFIENNYYVLPPIKEEYRAIDKMKEKSGLAYIIGWLIGMITVSAVRALGSLIYVVSGFNKVMAEMIGSSYESKLRELVETTPDYDYGASTSLREFASQNKYLQHFQKLDKELFFKTIDKRIFNSIAEFLDSKNINTSEFKERETSVLNNGIIVSGGSFTSENTSTGVGATINKLINPQKTTK